MKAFQESREIEARIALALGWRVVHVEGGNSYLYKPGDDECVAMWARSLHGPDYWKQWYVPRYTTDPAAADLVRKEIVKRWECYEEGRFYHGSSKNGLTYKCRIVTIKDPEASAIHSELFMARGLAFLAAVETDKGVKAG